MKTYRLIEQGEIIQSDDEILHDDCETWGEVNRWSIGMQYRPGFFVPMRRAKAAIIIGGGSSSNAAPPSSSSSSSCLDEDGDEDGSSSDK